MSITKDLLKVAAVICLPVATMFVASAAIKGNLSILSSIKISNGPIVYKKHGYCNDNGYCVPSEDLTNKQREIRNNWEPSSFGSMNFQEANVAFALKEAMAEYEVRTKPFQTAPLYFNTFDRILNYLDQGFALKEGVKIDDLARSVDAYTLELKGTKLAKAYRGSRARRLKEREKEIISSLVFDGPVPKKIDSIEQLSGIPNPEKFEKPSDLSQQVIDEMLVEGLQLVEGVSKISVARELDVALSSPEIPTLNQSATISMRFMPDKRESRVRPFSKETRQTERSVQKISPQRSPALANDEAVKIAEGAATVIGEFVPGLGTFLFVAKEGTEYARKKVWEAQVRAQKERKEAHEASLTPAQKAEVKAREKRTKAKKARELAKRAQEAAVKAEKERKIAEEKARKAKVAEAAKKAAAKAAAAAAKKKAEEDAARQRRLETEKRIRDIDRGIKDDGGVIDTGPNYKPGTCQIRLNSKRIKVYSIA